MTNRQATATARGLRAAERFAARRAEEVRQATVPPPARDIRCATRKVRKA